MRHINLTLAWCLIGAVDAESASLVAAILDQKGCDASICTNTGESPLDLARRKGLRACEEAIQKHNGKSFLLALRMDNDSHAIELLQKGEVGLNVAIGFVDAPPLYWAVDLVSGQ